MNNKVDVSFYPESLSLWKYKDRDLWYHGNLDLLKLKLAAIIGTREVSIKGIQRTKLIAKILVAHNYGIVSGLAKGVDKVAHETTLALKGKTIAVMGTPIDQCYPKENNLLKEEIERKGLVLSQFAPSEHVFQSNFPKRNVLMAALSDINIVIEAGEKSGVRYQVEAAIKLNKRVALLASLVEHKYHWILDALNYKNTYVLSSPKDLIALLDNPQINVDDKTAIDFVETKQESLFNDVVIPQGQKISKKNIFRKLHDAAKLLYRKIF